MNFLPNCSMFLNTLVLEIVRFKKSRVVVLPSAYDVIWFVRCDVSLAARIGIASPLNPKSLLKKFGKLVSRLRWCSVGQDSFVFLWRVGLEHCCSTSSAPGIQLWFDFRGNVSCIEQVLNDGSKLAGCSDFGGLP